MEGLFMKTLKVLVLLLLVSSFAVHLPAAGKMNAQAGMAYGFDVEEPGLQLGLGYYFTPQIKGGFDFIYWFIGVEGMSMMEFNFTGNYYFVSGQSMNFYALAALGYHHASIDIGGFSSSDGEVAFGLGGGVEFNLGAMDIYVEPRLFLSGFDQFALNAGIRFGF